MFTLCENVHSVNVILEQISSLIGHFIILYLDQLIGELMIRQIDICVIRYYITA